MDKVAMPSPGYDTDDIYFSYWSWSMIKTCPYKFKLRVLDNCRIPKKAQDSGTHVQGSVPHAQAEDFFKKPIEERDVNFFEDTFTAYWDKFVKSARVDYAKWGMRHPSVEALVKAAKDAGKTPDPPFGYKTWAEYGYFVKQAEAYNATRTLAFLIMKEALHTRVVSPELPFKEVIEPRRVEGQIEHPALVLGGRIDLVFEAPADMVDIWDIKAVKSPDRLDDEQLMFYRMGVESMGKRVRHMGYILLKQCDFKPVHVTREQIKDLKKHMRATRKYFELSHWPAVYKNYHCRICDVNKFCRVYQRRNQPFDPTRVFQTKEPGKVDL